MADDSRLPLEIAFHQIPSSAALEQRIREKARVLERFSDKITGCRVVVEKDHRTHTKGNLFAVRIHIALPGKDLVVNQAHSKDPAHADVYVALRDAFNAAVRQVEAYLRTRRGGSALH